LTGRCGDSSKPSAILIVHVDDRPDEIVEWAIGDMDPLANRIRPRRTHDFTVELVRPEFVDVVIGDESQLLAKRTSVRTPKVDMIGRQRCVRRLKWTKK
jgi:hypothetical protein